jgi:hypothetical protein
MHREYRHCSISIRASFVWRHLRQKKRRRDGGNGRIFIAPQIMCGWLRAA